MLAQLLEAFAKNPQKFDQELHEWLVEHDGGEGTTMDAYELVCVFSAIARGLHTTEQLVDVHVQTNGGMVPTDVFTADGMAEAFKRNPEAVAAFMAEVTKKMDGAPPFTPAA